MAVSGVMTAALAAVAALASQSPATMEQLSTANRDGPTPADALPGQLSSPVEARQAPRQLDTGPRTVSAPPQLAPAGRTALSPPPLSRRADGRVVATERLGGHDRCDPARASADAARCAQVVENRAADFARPRPVLSPEQKLLVEQRLGEPPRSLDTAMRRLVRNEGDPDSSDAQAIAAAALTGQASTAAPTKVETGAAADAPVVEAIIAGGGGVTVQPPPR